MRLWVSYFNSIKVRLERCGEVLPRLILTNFNSIKVRLELLREQIKKVSEQDFNSIKVRLERGGDNFCYEVYEFQFHKGAIRTTRRQKEKGLVNPFQFHKGAIRTR